MGAGPKVRPYVGASFPARRADKAWLCVGYPLIGGHRERVTTAGVHAIDTRTPVGPPAERISPKNERPRQSRSPPRRHGSLVIDCFRRTRAAPYGGRLGTTSAMVGYEGLHSWYHLPQNATSCSGVLFARRDGRHDHRHHHASNRQGRGGIAATLRWNSLKRERT
jgi:hypothetical protein